MKVLLDTRQKHWSQNPYIACLADSVAPADSVEGFSWRTALLSRYDVLHVHWPEYLVHSQGRWRSLAYRGLFALLLARIRFSGTVVVRTVHNEQPTVRLSTTERHLLMSMDRLCVRRIYLRQRQVTADSRDVYIPHGDYWPWLDRLGQESKAENARVDEKSVERRLLCFGILKPYKNFESAISAVSNLPSDFDMGLLVVGAPADTSYAEKLLALAEASDRVEVRLERLSDSSLVSFLRATQMVLVPYDNLNNSGVIFLCLTLGVPLAVPRGEVGLELQEEFGSARVCLFDAPLSSDALAAIITRLNKQPPLSPLSSESRSWSSVGSAHSELYAVAAGSHSR